jgi:hypothetical protein
MGQKRRLTVGRSFPVYPQLQTSPCTGLTDAMSHQRPSAKLATLGFCAKVPNEKANRYSE